jgi:uncharacterized membrane protein
MSLQLALVLVVLISMVGNRVLSLAAGLVLRVPTVVLLPVVYVMDLVQIPLFYWLYERGTSLFDRLPARLRDWFGAKESNAPKVQGWMSRLGGLGVFVVASLPSFGGGMWSAVFLAYGLKLRKTVSYALMATGSLFGYLGLYWVLENISKTLRLLVH